MRPHRLQYILPLTCRHACVGVFAALVVALNGNDSATLAQQITYGDQRSYYRPKPAPFDFETPLGYAWDPRDYFDSLTVPAGQEPISYIESYGGVTDLANLDNDPISFFRLTDDVDEDGIVGNVVVVDPVSGQLTTMTDFDDLHTFSIAFDQATIVQRSGLRSFDMGAVYWLYEEQAEPADSDGRAASETVSVLESYDRSRDNGVGGRRNPTVVTALPRLPVIPRFTRFAVNRRAGGLGFIYGFNEVAVRSTFEFKAEGGILGQTFSDTEANNRVKGPQAGLVAFKRLGPLSFYGHALALAGVNEGDIQQNNGIGAELIPGATNRLLYAQPSYSENVASYNEVAPTGLLWAEAGLQLTENSSVKLAWSANYVYNVLLAEDRVRYFLPDMGLVDPDTQHYFLQYLYCGIEVVR
jgi:hypothetical protein